MRFFHYFILASFSLFGQYDLKKLDERIQKFVDDGELVGIQTSVIKDGDIIHYKNYGYANIEDNIPLQEKSIFRIASITKCIVAVGIMKLYDKGLFKLNDPIEKYISEFKNPMVYKADGSLEPALNPIRVIDILRHTSGIGKTYPYLRNRHDDLKKNESLDLKIEVERLSKIPLATHPGTSWIYGPSVSLGAYMVEKLTGKKIQEYLKAELFDPLEMEDTFFEIPKEKIDRFTPLYVSDKRGGYKLLETVGDSPYTKKVTFCNPAGGLASTMKDVSNFCIMLLNNGTFKGKKILKKETVALMTQDHLKDIKNQKPSNDNHKPNDATGFGLTFNVLKNINAYPFPGSQGSYGWHGSAGPYFKIDPKENMILILLTNMKGWDYSRKEIFEINTYNSIFKL
tara:strand:- start:403 stop:1596 length:1194 start_codon:yes stop_codon:yes gene_type:complete